MRILWVGKAPTSGAAGDEIFDRKVIGALRDLGHTVQLFHPMRVPLWRELANLLVGVPHYRARFASGNNRRRLQTADREYDLRIISWEPFDLLQTDLKQPVLLIAHNITSLSLPALFPDSRIANAAGKRARLWERRYRRDRFAAIATLSRPDHDYVSALPNAPTVLLTIPGMPPAVELREDARFKREIVILGTFDWVPKRRDLERFTDEFLRNSERLAVFADGLPPSFAKALDARPASDVQSDGGAIRLGIITDRFVAGHKLKTLAHIAANHVVLSYADVAQDFLDIPEHDFFVRQLHSTEEIETVADELAAGDQVQLAARFRRFQGRCAEAFTWTGVAETISAWYDGSLTAPDDVKGP